MSEAIDLLVKKKAVEEVRKATEEVIKLDAEIIKLANDVNQFAGKPLFKPLPSDVNKKLGENSKFLSQINAKNKEAERLQNSLARAQAKLNAVESQRSRTLIKTRLETQLNNKALKDEAVLSSALVGAYRKLTTRRNQAATTLKNLIASEKASNREIRKAQREFDRLDRKVRKADRATNDFRRNVGNYSSALGKAGFALRSFIGVLGIYSGFEIAREVFEQVKALNGLNLALEQVTETQLRFNEAQRFLSDVAEESGNDIFVLTSRYTKFLAAAKTTNLTMSEVNNIFRQVAKAGGVLGLTTDDVNGAFRALEQILSKGKVQAEEIRGQLGERLPGAFQILAKSMGLTTQELDKQLELGNVLADEVLPGFAEELERTYNLQLVDRVETLAASQTRLGNAWKEFLGNVEGGQGLISSVFKDIFDGITNALNALTDFNKTFGQNQLEGEAMGVSTAIKAVKDESEKMNISFKEAAEKIIPRYQKIVSEWGDELSEVTSKQGQSAIKNFFNIFTGEFDKQEKTAKKAGKQIALYNKSIETLKQIIETGEIPEETKKTADSIKDQNKATDKAKTVLSGSIAAYRKIISELKDKQSRLAATNDEYEKYNRQIEEAEKNIEKLTRGLVDLSNVQDGDASAFGASQLGLGQQEDIAKGFAERQKERADAEILLEKQKQEALKALREGELRNVEFLTSEQTGAIRDALRLQLQLQQEFQDSKADLVLGGIDSIFQARISDIDREIEANQRRFDSITNFDELTEEQKQATREKFEKEQEQLERKKEKREKEAFLVQQGIAIAEIAINLARTISAINLTAQALNAVSLGTLGTAYAAANIPIAIGTAAAQTGLVLAQTIPQLEEGVENFEGGKAVINDAKGSNYQEIVQTPDGRMSVFKKRNVMVDLPKGTNVFSAQDSQEMLRDSFARSNQRNQEMIDLWLIRKSTLNEAKITRQQVVKGILEGFKKAKITNNNKIVIEESYTRY